VDARPSAVKLPRNDAVIPDLAYVGDASFDPDPRTVTERYLASTLGDRRSPVAVELVRFDVGLSGAVLGQPGSFPSAAGAPASAVVAGNVLGQLVVMALGKGPRQNILVDIAVRSGGDTIGVIESGTLYAGRSATAAFEDVLVRALKNLSAKVAAATR
jgi:hypothetical protein